MYQRREFERGTTCALPQLIARNATLEAGLLLVLMYEQGQVQMNDRQGVASWLKETLDKHGMPSLIRFGRKDRATVLRRDEFIAWFTPFLNSREA